MTDQSSIFPLLSDDGIRTCRYCLWDIRFDDTGWTLAYDHASYACEDHDGNHAPKDIR